MAAETEAEVTGIDLSDPRRDRPQAGCGAWRQRAVRGGRRRGLRYPDESFDIVTSSVGAIFAPNHAVVASELARVCRTGGRLALTAWATEGGVDEFFKIIGRYAPPPATRSGHGPGGVIPRTAMKLLEARSR